MTRRDYIAISSVIFQLGEELEALEHENGIELLEAFAHKLANICEKDNPRFDRDRFMRACGLDV